MVPWLVLGFLILLLVWPAVLYGEVWYTRIAQQEEAKPGFSTTLGTPRLIAESQHFHILTYENFVHPASAQAFAKKAERQRVRLMNFLSIPENNRVVTVVLLPDCGISQSGADFWMTIKTCNNRLLPMQSIMIMHELTHSLMTPWTYYNTSSIFTEGLAVMTGEHFGWAVPYFSLNFDMYFYLRKGTLIPLTDLYTQVWSADQYQPDLTSQRYVESGCFARYLVSRYGIESYLSAYKDNGNFETIYGKSLTLLEQGWLRSLRIGNLLQAILFTIAGTGILCLVTLSVLRGRQWIPAALTAWLAFLLWSWYAFYPVWFVPGCLLIAAVLGGFVANRRQRVGLWLMWLGGAGTLAGFMLMPALLLLLR